MSVLTIFTPFIRRFQRDRKAVTALECGPIASLIAEAINRSATLVGTNGSGIQFHRRMPLV